MIGRCGAVALIVLAVSVGGCLEGESRELGSDGTPQTGESAVSAEDANVTAYTFSGRGPGVATEWFNGTIPPVNECPLECTMRPVDITSLLPEHQPSRLEVRLETSGMSVVGGDTLGFDVRASEGAVLYAMNYTVPDRQSRNADGVVLRGSGLVEVVIGHTGYPADEEFDYTVEVRATWDPSVVPASVPVAFDASAREVLLIVPQGETDVTAVVYDPGGEAVARFSEPGPVEFVAPGTGRFVLLPFADGGNLTLRSNASGPERLIPMRVEQTFAVSEPFVAAVAAPHSWTFSTDVAPVRVGAVFVFPMAVEASATHGRVLIESPVDVVVDHRGPCADVCSVGIMSTRPASSDPGHPGLVPGEYTVTYTPGAAEAGLAYHFVETIVPV